MSDPLFHTDSPLSLQMAARAERDRYLARLVKISVRALWTAVFGTRKTAHDAAEALQACYVREQGLIAAPDAADLDARRSNDRPGDGAIRAA